MADKELKIYLVFCQTNAKSIVRYVGNIAHCASFYFVIPQARRVIHGMRKDLKNLEACIIKSILDRTSADDDCYNRQSK